MFQPTAHQWLAIWITTGIALLLWVGAASYSATRTQERLALSAVVVGALVIWKLAGPKNGSPKL
jgi:hypothetical protein